MTNKQNNKKIECDCGCHTSPHSDKDMKENGCDLCYLDNHSHLGNQPPVQALKEIQDLVDKKFNEAKDNTRLASHPVYETKPTEKEWEDNYESKGGYCPIHTEILDNGGCLKKEAEKHIKQLNKFISKTLANEKEKIVGILEKEIKGWKGSTIHADVVERIVLPLKEAIEKIKRL